MTIEETKNRDEIVACFPVMVELRTQFDAESFTRQVRKQELKGFHLARGQLDGEVVCVTGFWLRESLAWGRHVYVDDLVTKAEQRSAGHGDAMLEWLIAWARKRECAELHLDSGVQRFGAHRFYLNHRMDITSHHFAIQS